MTIEFKIGKKKKVFKVKNKDSLKNAIAIAWGQVLRTQYLSDIDDKKNEISIKLDGEKITLNEFNIKAKKLFESMKNDEDNKKKNDKSNKKKNKTSKKDKSSDKKKKKKAKNDESKFVANKTKSKDKKKKDGKKKDKSKNKKISIDFNKKESKKPKVDNDGTIHISRRRSYIKDDE